MTTARVESTKLPAELGGIEVMVQAPDKPWNELIELANTAVKQGWTLFFKFTCEHCGERQTFDVPNVLYTKGKCEECGHITSLVGRGGGMLIIRTNTGRRYTDRSNITEVDRQQE